MNSKIAILLFGACLALVSLAEAKGKHKFQCKGEEIKFSDDQKTGMQTCWKELKERNKGTDSDDDSKKHYKPDACFTACKLDKFKSVKDGKIDTDNVNKLIEAGFPSAVQTAIKDALKKCADAVTETLSMDNNCKSYEGYGKCAMGAIMKNCKNSNEDDA